MNSKSSILEKVKELLEAPDCVVRVQREIKRVNYGDNRDGSAFETGPRVTLIIVATPPQKSKASTPKPNAI